MDPTTRRIKNKLDSKFPNIPDCPSDEIAQASRRLAALAIEMESGETNPQILIDSITDGQHDQGIDALYLDENQKELILVQSKWRTKGTGTISSAEMAKFANAIDRCFEFDFDNPNSKFRGKYNDIEKGIGDAYTVKAIMISTTTDPIPEENLYPLKKLQDRINDVDDVLRFSYFDKKKIYDYLLNNQKHSIDLTIELNNWGYINEPYKAYYGTVDAANIAEWYQQFGNSLFSQNIRFFKDNTEVNDGIQNTLDKEPENFFLYNNGIKLLCSEASRATHSVNHKSTIFTLKNASIVNGAQTTGSIAKFYQNKPSDDIKEAPVFVEVIDLTGMPESAAATISKLSNTQNRIEGKDFAALDPEQDRIARELAFEEQPIHYIYRTGSFTEDIDSRSCTLDEAIPALACEQDDIKLVTLAKSNVGALTSNTSKAPYTTLFNQNTNSIVLYNSVQVMRYVDDKLSKEYKKKQGKEKLISTHGNRFLLHLVLQAIKKELTFSDQILNEKTLQDLVDKILPIYIRQTQKSLVKLYPDAYPANVFKSAGRCKDLKEDIMQQKESI